MNYHENETLIHAYLDNELDTPASLALLEHAQGCAACRADLESFAGLKENLRKQLPHYSTPPALRRAILASVQPNQRFFWQSIVRLVTPIAVSLALGVWIGIMFTAPKDDTNDIVWNHIRSLKSGHLMDVVSSDKHTVKPWFAGKTDFSPVVIDLSANGFPLLGARVEKFDGHDVAALVYTNGKHYLELYEWPAGEKIGAATGIFRGFNTTLFEVGGMNCYLVSDASKEELEKFQSALIVSLKGQ